MVLARVKLITGQGLVSPDLLVMKEVSWDFSSSKLLQQKYPCSPGEASMWQSTSRYCWEIGSEDSEATQSHSTFTAVVNMTQIYIYTIKK